MDSLRFRAVEEAANRQPISAEIPTKRPSDYYASLVFNRKTMYEYLPLETYRALTRAIDNREPLPRDVADSVAEGMKRWAINHGARHYSHWFQPLTETTAEKHDAFIDFDGKGGVMEEFTGKLLVQQEPDASSFPNGGIRNTFEARGYSAWDISSPAFILRGTLCIPTIFISYTGESLDYKTPLLRSLAALDRAATSVTQLFSPEVRHVQSNLGWEQEYFLIDEALCNARPDLMLTGRTLMGHESAKNQQLEDHYFGAIPARVEAFMLDLETEAYRLGIPLKTRHNEVAPNQFEFAPIFEETNLANDHNMLVMSLMGDVARRHHFRVLLHPKPFAGVNGSGKHCNWSMSTDTGEQLLSPSHDPMQNLRFITFVANVMAAVHRHNALLKASVMSADNSHRLGANEAPPAIISIFTGSQLSEILAQVATATDDQLIDITTKQTFTTGLSQIPDLRLDTTDRNRTSPFAFTGNRFEFRAVSSSANCGAPMIALNAVVADQLAMFRKAVDEHVAKGQDTMHAILAEVRCLIRSSEPIHFDGNGYTNEWKEEATRRGLDTETNPALIFDAYLRRESVEMFTRTNVLTPRELQARNEVKWEMYTKKIQIEARVLGDLAINHIIPVATRYLGILLDNMDKARRIFGDNKGTAMTASDAESAESIMRHTSAIRTLTDEMVEARKVANRIVQEREKAIAYAETIAPKLDAIRRHIDKLELTVDNQLWPLPKYRELLFTR